MFSGESRHNDLVMCVKLQAEALGMSTETHDYDVKRSPADDLLDDAPWMLIKQRMKYGVYHLAVASPPCSTFFCD